MARPRYRRGFSLIELLVVAGIAAILAAIAVPGYRGHVLRVHRSEALQALLALAAAQERHHLQHGRYAGTLDGADDAAAERLPIAATTGEGRYRLTIEAADDVRYTARATATGNQADDRACAVLGIDETGARRAWNLEGARNDSRCWR